MAVCVVLVVESAAPAAAIGSSQFSGGLRYLFYFSYHMDLFRQNLGQPMMMKAESMIG